MWQQIGIIKLKFHFQPWKQTKIWQLEVQFQNYL